MRKPPAHRLEARALALQRGHRMLVLDYSVAVSTGEIVAVRGPSGSGKTTLLRSIAGLISPHSGHVELDGKAPEGAEWPTYRSRVTYVGQQPAFVDGSVRDNLTRPFRYECRADDYSEDGAVELLESWSLGTETLDQPADQLSVGEQQRVALARALLTRPWFLLLDEPTSALDTKTARRVLHRLQHEAKHGGFGALIVSHDESLLESIETGAVDFPGVRR